MVGNLIAALKPHRLECFMRIVRLACLAFFGSTVLASGAGVAAEYRECAGATHSHLHEACPDDFRDWVLGFLAP